MWVPLRGASTWRPYNNRNICHWVLLLKRKVITLDFLHTVSNNFSRVRTVQAGSDLHRTRSPTLRGRRKRFTARTRSEVQTIWLLGEWVNFFKKNYPASTPDEKYTTHTRVVPILLAQESLRVKKKISVCTKSTATPQPSNGKADCNLQHQRKNPQKQLVVFKNIVLLTRRAQQCHLCIYV